MPEQLGLAGSTLPTFDVAEPPEIDDGVRYTCSRCSRAFFTLEGARLEAATAPCPHCFKVSQVPA